MSSLETYVKEEIFFYLVETKFTLSILTPMVSFFTLGRVSTILFNCEMFGVDDIYFFFVQLDSKVFYRL